MAIEKPQQVRKARKVKAIRVAAVAGAIYLDKTTIQALEVGSQRHPKVTGMELQPGYVLIQHKDGDMGIPLHMLAQFELAPEEG